MLDRPIRCLPHPATLASLAVATLLGVSPPSVRADEGHVADSACVEDACGDRCQEALSMVRRVTAKYHVVDVAIADGYVPEDVCVAIPGVGGMGYHAPNPQRTMDTEVEARFPEVLLYASKPNGQLRLVGVEYLAPVLSNGVPWTDPVAPPPTVDNPPPVLFGQTFQGPMPGHAPGMPWHYDLHVWLWRHNPDGMFAVWNPKITCP